MAFIEVINWCTSLYSKELFSFTHAKDPQSVLGGHLAEIRDQPEPDVGLKGTRIKLLVTWKPSTGRSWTLMASLLLVRNIGKELIWMEGIRYADAFMQRC